MALPPGCYVICYANDTLVVAGGSNWEEASALANLGVACVMRTIGRMRLEVVSSFKTEAMFFHDGSCGNLPRANVTVEGDSIQVGGGGNEISRPLSG